MHGTYLGCTILVLALALPCPAQVGNAEKSPVLPVGPHTIAGPATVEGAPGSSTVIFINAGGPQFFYVTVVNHGQVDVAFVLSQPNSAPASYKVQPKGSCAFRFQVTSMVQLSFGKAQEQSGVGKATWRIDLVPNSK
jgi:hypothetical protein